MWPGFLIGWHAVNVALAALTQEFRLAFPLYLAALMSLPLVWFAFRPEEARLGDPQSPIVTGGRPLQDRHA